MEKEMRTLYVEGLAIHDGPESCVDVREDGSEALTGVRAGWAIEPRNQEVRGADAVVIRGRPHRRQRHRKLPTDPGRSETLRMYGVSMRENREIPYSPFGLIARRDAQARPRP
jgi:hypothetical protein